ncbi:MAG: hypothetical protein ACTHXB_05050 [Luteimonas sp.]
MTVRSAPKEAAVHRGFFYFSAWIHWISGGHDSAYQERSFTTTHCPPVHRYVVSVIKYIPCSSHDMSTRKVPSGGLAATPWQAKANNMPSANPFKYFMVRFPGMRRQEYRRADVIPAMC